jgi:cysteine desulfurase
MSIMLANNESGVLQDLAEFAAICKQNNILIHTDAVQAIGKLGVDFKQLGVNLMTMSSHKIYGPKGSGALIIEPQIKLSPLLIGGGQEQGLRAGTENVAAIIGFGKAAEIAKDEWDKNYPKLLNLRQLLEKGLKTIPGLTIFAEHQLRLPNTLQFGLPNSDGEMLLMQLDRHGIAVSSGSACKTGGGKPSHVLLAMGIDPVLAKSAIRVSLGKHNTIAEIEQFISVLKSLI